MLHALFNDQDVEMAFLFFCDYIITQLGHGVRRNNNLKEPIDHL
jgi:hypothetical protein